MRADTINGDFKARAIAGTRAVLMAMDCADACRDGLMGFAIGRTQGGSSKPYWLPSQKVFKSVIPDPTKERDPKDPSKRRRDFDCREHPFQSFLWSNYTAKPDTAYTFTIVPMYGRPGALTPGPEMDLEVRTEKEIASGHGVWFNRGAIASQSFADKYGNVAPTEAEINDPDADKNEWLSRGLVKACLAFIDGTPAGEGLRVAAYEFTYKPVLDSLKRALDRGVDTRIVYHDTTGAPGSEKGANENAIAAAGLPAKKGDKQVLFPRTRAKIPHNKFIVRMEGGTQPTAVWTGSTNFTPSGFLGQSNVGHLVEDRGTARRFLDYWRLLKSDPTREQARDGAVGLSPDPPDLIPTGAVARVFSPRPDSQLLGWYGDRIDDAVNSVMFTAAFGVTDKLIPPLARDRDFLRFILLEKPLTEAAKKKLCKDRDLVMSYGAALGEMYGFKDGKPTARKKIKDFELEKWLLKEDHYRREGFVFFVHTKYLLIDPLSNDPLVCTGSANFSPPSLLENDENMLLIRGDTRVADIYVTEFDRLFRHFYFRNVANEIAAAEEDKNEDADKEVEGVFLSEDSSWTDGYFRPGAFKTRRREMFFADPAECWVRNAAGRG